MCTVPAEVRPGKPVRKPRPKPERFVRLDRVIPLEGPGEVVITVNGKPTAYLVDALPADFGLGFRLSKPVWDGGESYDVLLDLQGDGHSCECLGFYAHGHCKHVEAFLKLYAEKLVS